MKIALHWRILGGMALGVMFGSAAVALGWQPFVVNWIKPLGDIFLNLLKLIAVPLIIGSLIKGVTDLKDLSKLSSMGAKTFGIYLVTTALAVSIGLVLVNLTRPGLLIAEESRESLKAAYAAEATQKIADAEKEKAKPILQPLVDMVPENVFGAASSNRNMLQVIMFVLFFAVGLLLIPEEKARPVIALFDGLNDVVMKMVDLIMLAAPFGVFALLANLIVQAPSKDIFIALLGYMLTVVAGLLVLLLIVYPGMVRLFAGRGPVFFLRNLFPAQLVAFSTSSSAATLPITMERVEKHLGVDEDVASFVLPIGATVNMDGTALYQAVAAVFIAQTYGLSLDLGAQLGIILTATLASIGSAAVPGAGVLMLIIVLSQAGIPEAGVALILAVDRPLDMLRTVTNVTSDAACAMVIAKSEGRLRSEADAEKVPAEESEHGPTGRPTGL